VRVVRREGVRGGLVKCNFVCVLAWNYFSPRASVLRPLARFANSRRASDLRDTVRRDLSDDRCDPHSTPNAAATPDRQEAKRSYSAKNSCETRPRAQK
jgi:hypothetical protein